MVASCVLIGCHVPDDGSPWLRSVAHRRGDNLIRRIICLFDQKPWLNLDVAGDRDPEGIHYRVFLDAGKNRGEIRDGAFYVEMYRIDRKSGGKIDRTLVSDWNLPAANTVKVKSKILGMGHHLHLRWAKKGIAGEEIEVITTFKTPTGGTTRSTTKRLYVPSYKS